jgi:hypothetical protein
MSGCAQGIMNGMGRLRYYKGIYEVMIIEDGEKLARVRALEQIPLDEYKIWDGEEYILDRQVFVKPGHVFTASKADLCITKQKGLNAV